MQVRTLASVPVFEKTFVGSWEADEDASRRAVFQDIQEFLAARPEMSLPARAQPKRVAPKLPALVAVSRSAPAGAASCAPCTTPNYSTPPPTRCGATKETLRQTLNEP